MVTERYDTGITFAQAGGFTYPTFQGEPGYPVVLGGQAALG